MYELSDYLKNQSRRRFGRERTVAEVFDTLSSEQKNVVYFLIGSAIEETKMDIIRKLIR